MGDAFDPAGGRMLLLVGNRACTIAHAMGGLFRLPLQFARFLPGAIA
jgi:hypothetical protein